MQTAFFLTLIFPPPASGAEVVAFLHRTCTGRTADTRKSAVVQSIVGYIIFFDILLHLFKSPEKNRMNLHQLVYLVPLNPVHLFPVLRLVRPNTGYPNLFTGQGPVQGLHLTDAAALLAVIDRFIKAIRTLGSYELPRQGEDGIVNLYGAVIAT